MKTRNGEKTAVHNSKVASQYRSVYGWVEIDVTSSFLTTIQNADLYIEMYALANGRTIWSNSNLRINETDLSNFRFETISVWYAEFKKNNGKSEVLSSSLRQPRKRRNVYNVLLSPRKGKKRCIFLWSDHHQERKLEFNIQIRQVDDKRYLYHYMFIISRL